MKNPAATTTGHVFKRIHKGSGSSKLIMEILGAATEDTGKRAGTVKELIDEMGMTLSMTCQECDTKWTEDPEVLRKDVGEETLMKEVRRPCPKCESLKVFAMPVSIKA